MGQGLTATERRIYDLLSDGKPHDRREIFSLLNDDLARLGAINNRISQLRKKLPEPYTIVCVLLNNKLQYRLLVEPPIQNMYQIFPPIPIR